MRLIAILLALLIALPILPAGAETRTIRHDGTERSYRIDRPARADGPLPALVVLHGGGGSARQIRRHAGFRLSRAGWAVIYPQGLNKSWNDGRTGADGSLLRTADDAGFLLAMIDDLARRGEIDPARVFFAGISNGGAMSIRMACAHPRRVAGIAVVAMTVPEGLPCPPRRPVPALFILGDADPLVPYDGGPVTLGRRDRGRVLAAADSLRLWARANRCRDMETAMLPDRDPADGIRIGSTRGLRCAAPLVILTAKGGGHTWPGARRRPLMEKIVGPTARDISATAEIERFVRALARD